VAKIKAKSRDELRDTFAFLKLVNMVRATLMMMVTG